MFYVVKNYWHLFVEIQRCTNSTCAHAIDFITREPSNAQLYICSIAQPWVHEVCSKEETRPHNILSFFILYHYMDTGVRGIRSREHDTVEPTLACPGYVAEHSVSWSWLKHWRSNMNTKEISFQWSWRAIILCCWTHPAANNVRLAGFQIHGDSIRNHLIIILFRRDDFWTWLELLLQKHFLNLTAVRPLART